MSELQIGLASIFAVRALKYFIPVWTIKKNWHSLSDMLKILIPFHSFLHINQGFLCTQKSKITLHAFMVNWPLDRCFVVKNQHWVISTFFGYNIISRSAIQC